MKPERALVAERILARHCPELLREGPSPGELMARLEPCGDAIAKAIASELIPLMASKPTVRAHACDETSLGDMAAKADRITAVSLLKGPGDLAFWVSFEAGAVFRLVDRTFGGKGDAPSPLPDAFPDSARLIIGRLEMAMMSAMAVGFGFDAELLRVQARASNNDELAPLAPDGGLVGLVFSIEEASGPTWQASIALPLSALPVLLGEGGQVQSVNQPGSRRHPADEPFGALPLTLKAVLVDMAVPVSLLSALRPGHILPVAVARSVPLLIGHSTIGHGMVGAIDDRVAIRVSDTFQNNRSDCRTGHYS